MFARARERRARDDEGFESRTESEHGLLGGRRHHRAIQIVRVVLDQAVRVGRVGLGIENEAVKVCYDGTARTQAVLLDS